MIGFRGDITMQLIHSCMFIFVFIFISQVLVKFGQARLLQCYIWYLILDYFTTKKNRHSETSKGLFQELDQ